MGEASPSVLFAALTKCTYCFDFSFSCQEGVTHNATMGHGITGNLYVFLHFSVLTPKKQVQSSPGDSDVSSELGTAPGTSRLCNYYT